MKDTGRELIVAGFLGALVGGMLFAEMACRPEIPLSDAADVALYQTLELQCVAEAGTEEQARRCVCSVRMRWDRPCDAGTGGPSHD